MLLCLPVKLWLLDIKYCFRLSIFFLRLKRLASVECVSTNLYCYHTVNSFTFQEFRPVDRQFLPCFSGVFGLISSSVVYSIKYVGFGFAGSERENMGTFRMRQSIGYLFPG